LTDRHNRPLSLLRGVDEMRHKKQGRAHPTLQLRQHITVNLANVGRIHNTQCHCPSGNWRRIAKFCQLSLESIRSIHISTRQRTCFSERCWRHSLEGVQGVLFGVRHVVYMYIFRYSPAAAHKWQNHIHFEPPLTTEADHLKLFAPQCPTRPVRPSRSR
jgi:hypothetical protein